MWSGQLSLSPLCTDYPCNLQDFVSSGSLRSRCPAPITATITKYQSRARVPMTISCLWATGYTHNSRTRLRPKFKNRLDDINCIPMSICAGLSFYRCVLMTISVATGISLCIRIFWKRCCMTDLWYFCSVLDNHQVVIDPKEHAGTFNSHCTIVFTRIKNTSAIKASDHIYDERPQSAWPMGWRQNLHRHHNQQISLSSRNWKSNWHYPR